MDLGGCITQFRGVNFYERNWMSFEHTQGRLGNFSIGQETPKTLSWFLLTSIRGCLGHCVTLISPVRLQLASQFPPPFLLSHNSTKQGFCRPSFAKVSASVLLKLVMNIISSFIVCFSLVIAWGGGHEAQRTKRPRRPLPSFTQATA